MPIFYCRFKTGLEVIMSLRDNLQSSLRNSGDTKKEKEGHSEKVYHEYFDGYAEYRDESHAGKGRIVRTYTDDYYKQNITKSRLICLRLLYLVIFIALLLLFVSGALSGYSGHHVWFVTISEGVCIVFIFCILLALANYMISGINLTIYIYSITSKSLIKAAGRAAVSLCIAAIAVLLSWILSEQSESVLVPLTCAIKYLSAGALSFTLQKIENHIPYIRIPSGNIVPVNNSGFSKDRENNPEDEAAKRL